MLIFRSRNERNGAMIVGTGRIEIVADGASGHPFAGRAIAVCGVAPDKTTLMHDLASRVIERHWQDASTAVMANQRLGQPYDKLSSQSRRNNYL